MGVAVPLNVPEGMTTVSPTFARSDYAGIGVLAVGFLAYAAKFYV